jgi:hypothetical protein
MVKMSLDDLNQVRQCLYEAHNHIGGKIVVNRELMLKTLEESLDIVTQAILEEKHKNGGKGKKRPVL